MMDVGSWSIGSVMGCERKGGRLRLGTRQRSEIKDHRSEISDPRSELRAQGSQGRTTSKFPRQKRLNEQQTTAKTRVRHQHGSHEQLELEGEVIVQET